MKQEKNNNNFVKKMNALPDISKSKISNFPARRFSEINYNSAFIMKNPFNTFNLKYSEDSNYQNQFIIHHNNDDGRKKGLGKIIINKQYSRNNPSIEQLLEKGKIYIQKKCNMIDETFRLSENYNEKFSSLEPSSTKEQRSIIFPQNESVEKNSSERKNTSYEREEKNKSLLREKGFIIHKRNKGFKQRTNKQGRSTLQPYQQNNKDQESLKQNYLIRFKNIKDNRYISFPKEESQRDKITSDIFAKDEIDVKDS